VGQEHSVFQSKLYCRIRICKNWVQLEVTNINFSLPCIYLSLATEVRGHPHVPLCRRHDFYRQVCRLAKYKNVLNIWTSILVFCAAVCVCIIASENDIRLVVPGRD